MNTQVSVREKIESVLINDSQTQDAAIEVINNGGIVTLIGKVESEDIAQAAEELARSQDGVIKVINSLVVKN